MVQLHVLTDSLCKFLIAFVLVEHILLQDFFSTKYSSRNAETARMKRTINTHYILGKSFTLSCECGNLNVIMCILFLYVFSSISKYLLSYQAVLKKRSDKVNTCANFGVQC